MNRRPRTRRLLLAAVLITPFAAADAAGARPDPPPVEDAGSELTPMTGNLKSPAYCTVPQLEVGATPDAPAGTDAASAKAASLTAAADPLDLP